MSKNNIILLLLLFVLTMPLLGQSYKELLPQLVEKAEFHFYTNKDSVYFYYNKIYHLSLQNDDYITAIDNLNYLCESAGYHYDVDKIKETFNLAETLVTKHKSILDTLSDKGNFQINYLNYNKGSYYNKLENYNQAQEAFQKIEENVLKEADYHKNLDNLGFLSTAYSFIAQMNAVQHRFKVADAYYQKNIRLLEKFTPDDKENIYKVFNLYANSLYRQKKYRKAKEYWRRSFLYNSSNFSPGNRNSIASTGLLLSKVYSELNQLDSATYFLAKTNTYGIPEHFEHRYLITSGDISGIQEKNEDAEKSLLNALNLAPSVDKSLINRKLGDLLAKQNKLDLALNYYQDGLKSMSEKFYSDSFFDNPSPENVYQKQELLQTIRQKSKALNKQKNTESYKANLKVTQTGVSTIDLLKPSFKNDKDKAFLIENAYPLFESGILATYQLFKSSENDFYIDEAFKYTEKSKAVLLLEALLSSQATEFANIPEDLLDREKQLKSEITRIEKKLSYSDNPDVFLEDDLFELRQEYRNLLVNFETNYPSYFDLKYNNEVLTLDEVQQKLDDNELLISYFYGNENIYTIAASKSENHFTKTAITSKLEDDIYRLHAMLAKSTSDQDSLQILSHSLHQEIIEPILKLFPEENIIVIPDGLLNYVPFGSLITNIEQNRYLIEDKSVSYANSATLWSKLNNRLHSDAKLLALAPSFNSNTTYGNQRSDILGNLPHNKKEVSQILESFSGDSFLANEATLNNFTSSVSDYSILHMATHAVFDDKNPEYSYLAFTPDAKTENLLFVKDLYNLSLNAGLVTLSACESGIGELRRGEGFLSLARGFFYSGASSISSTLWKVNDNSSSMLMGDFYKYLAYGDSKDQALREAKLSFLEKNRDNGLSHPYYWSGYIIQGNTKPLVSKSYQSYYLITLAFIFLFSFMNRKRLLKFFK